MTVMTSVRSSLWTGATRSMRAPGAQGAAWARASLAGGVAPSAVQRAAGFSTLPPRAAMPAEGQQGIDRGTPLGNRRMGLPKELGGEEGEKIAVEPQPAKPAKPAEASSSRRSSASEQIQQRAAKKAAITLLPAAVERLRAMRTDPSDPRTIRVSVRNKGCAGMSYHLEYVRPEEKGRFDETVKQDGVELLIDSRALFSVIGSTMDWKEDKLSAKFVFTNPNVKNECGCGESFMT